MPPLPRDFVTWHCGASPGERPPWNPPLAWGGPLEPPRWTVTESTRHCRTSPAYNLLSVEGRQGARPGALGVAAAYVLLFLLGAMEGVIGCFQFSRSIGSFPVAALGFCALILVTCLLAGAGMGSPMGALVVAAGWLAASFVLTLPTAAGSVIVTNTTAGKLYLYGGAVCAAIGIVASFRWRPRRPSGDQRQELRL